MASERDQLIQAAKDKWEREQLIREAKEKYSARKNPEPVDIPSTEELMAKNFKPGILDAGVIGMGQGLYSNFGDELLGRAMALGEGEFPWVTKGWDDSVKRNVKDARDAFGATKKAHPIAHGVGEVGGAVAQTMVPILNSSKGVTAARYGKAALQGGLSGLGGADKDTITERLPGAAWGAGGGLLGQGLSENAIQPGLEKVGDWLQKGSQRRAWKAAGAMLPDFRKLDHQGKLDEGGQMLLDEGVVRFGNSVKGIAKKAQKRADYHGGVIGEVSDAIDKGFNDYANSPLKSSLFHPHRAAARLQNELVAPNQGTAMEDALGPVMNEIKRLKDMTPGPIKYADGRKLTKAIDQFLEYSKEQTPSREMLKRARGILNNELEGSVDSIISDAGARAKLPAGEADRLFNAWKGTKGRYGVMKDAADIAHDRIFRDEANRLLSPSDYGTGLTGALGGLITGGNPLTWGVAAAGANRIARTRGSSMMAKTMQRGAGGAYAGQELSKYVGPKLGEMALRQNEEKPEQRLSRAEMPAENVITKLSRSPEGQSYAKILGDAYTKSPQDFAIKYHVLSNQDENFNRALNADDIEDDSNEGEQEEFTRDEEYRKQRQKEAYEEALDRNDWDQMDQVASEPFQFDDEGEQNDDEEDY